MLFGGSVAARYAKHHLPNYGVFDEFRYFVRGDAFPVLRLHGVDVGMTICEDLWQEGGPVAVAERAGVDVLVCINGSPYERGKSHTRDALAARRAREAGAYLAYVNTVGGQDELVFDGDSLAVDPAGNLLVRARQFDEELLVVDVDVEPRGRKVTGPVDARDGTTMAVERVTLVADPVAAYSAAPRVVQPRLDSDEELYRAVVTGTRDYIMKNHFPAVVLGLSGGIDSAMVATIAVDALGAGRVSTVAMPSRYSSQHSLEDAAELATRQGVHHQVVPITGILDAFQKELGLTGLAEENLQARIRGTILMGLSNQFGSLVLTTGNKSELATGFSTLYGDSAGGFAPIKDVPKTLVWALARWRNAHAARPRPAATDPGADHQQAAVRRVGARSARQRPATRLRRARRGARRVRRARPGTGAADRRGARGRDRGPGHPPRGRSGVQASAEPAGAEGDQQGVRPRPALADHLSLARAGHPVGRGAARVPARSCGRRHHARPADHR